MTKQSGGPLSYLIGIVGQMCAGKGTFSEHLQKTHDVYKVCTMSWPLKETLRRFGIDPNERNNTSDLGKVLCELGGPSSMVAPWRVEIAAAKDEGKLLILDGVRTLDVHRYLVENYPHYRLIAITASMERRYRRMLGRGRAGEENITYLEFVRRHQISSEQEIDAVIDAAHVRIDNDSFRKTRFHHAIDRVMRTL